MSEAPISLEEARRRRRRGGGDARRVAECPLVALGHLDGAFHFLDISGQERRLTARQMGSRAEISALFLGDTAWLAENFPRVVTTRSVVDGETVVDASVQGFSHAAAGEFLMARCREAGIFGTHVVVRRAGIWAGADGAPLAHCGDGVRGAGGWRGVGFREGAQVFAASAPVPRPADAAASAEIARGLCADVRELWRARDAGAEIVLLGLVGCGFLGAAPRWRPNGFITGGAGSGKSMLLDFLRACWPLHHYTNETSKAGLEQALSGRAMPSAIDESSDRADQAGAQALLDVVLAATGGEGTKGHRGSAEGRVRVIEVLGVMVMASVSPPEFLPQHRSRFALVELMQPDGGADHAGAMAEAIGRARAAGPALWARALDAWPRWARVLAAFREALGARATEAREMDQLGAILAGWWVLVEDGVPGAAEAEASVRAVDAFVRGREASEGESAPRRCIDHLLASLVQRDRSTERATVGELIAGMFDPLTDAGEIARARTDLSRYGICVPLQSARGDGIWLLPASPALRGLFGDGPWRGTRWEIELLRLNGAFRSKVTVRVGKGATGKAIWVPRRELWAAEEDSS
ncbi:MAG: ATP-binding protein [Rhodospirillales bacterium]|nr:ATP-binding protein [Rhodospirillales bacterium]